MHWATKTIVISKKEIRRKKEMLVPLFNIRIQWRYLHTDQKYLYLLYFDPQIIYTHIGNFYRKQPRFLYRKLWNNRVLYNVWV